MKLIDDQVVKGKLSITRINSKGEVVEKIHVPNLVVTTGKEFIASRMVGTTSAVMSHMAVGTGAVAPDVANTTLGTEAGRVVLGSASATSATVTYTATFPPGTGTGAITEAGIFNASSAGIMLSRTTFPVVNKGAGDTIAISWSIVVS